MSEHHGLDLDAIERASGGHSIFAPSAAAMWLTCAGSLIPNITALDDAGVDAAYGTVGHGVAETWLKRIKRTLDLEDAIAEGRVEDLIDSCAPRELLGTVERVQERVEAFDILIDEAMFDYVREYIVWCAEAPGEHYIEERVYFSKLTPLKKQGGTADFAACAPAVLRIRDLKMGQGEQVYAAYIDLQDKRSLIDGKFNGNPQGMLYALGFFFKFDAQYHFETIEIGIGQPRLGHFQVWETTREELLKFAEFVKVRALAAWQPDAPRTPSPKGCRWCKVRRNCAALAGFVMNPEAGDVFERCDDEGDVIEGEFKVVSNEKMLATKAALDDPAFVLTMADPATLTTEQMAKLLPYRKIVEGFFKDMEAELMVRNKAGEKIPGFKLVEARGSKRVWKDEKKAARELPFLGVPEEKVFVPKVLSPAQAEEAMKAATGLKKDLGGMLISHLVSRTQGRDALVQVSDKREELEDRGSVFDDVSGDDL